MNIDEDTLLKRGPFARALTEAGFPTASSTLATKATRGGGPPYELWWRIPLYRWGPGLAWARARLRAPVRNSSEAGAAAAPLQLTASATQPLRAVADTAEDNESEEQGEPRRLEGPQRRAAGLSRRKVSTRPAKISTEAAAQSPRL